jgi:hypothetical protein
MAARAIANWYGKIERYHPQQRRRYKPPTCVHAGEQVVSTYFTIYLFIRSKNAIS